MKIAYVLKRFPRFSETFIVNEILELEKQGVEVEIYALMLPPEDEIRHENLALIKAPVFYLPLKDQSKHICILQGSAIDIPSEKGLDKSLTDPSFIFDDLFPGKKSSAAIHLSFQAYALAMLASGRGVEHFHAHFATDSTTVALIASRISQIAYSFTAHAKDIYHTYVSVEKDKALLEKKINEASFVITVSEFNRQHLNVITDNQSKDKIMRLYNGIDLSKFTSSGKKNHRQFIAVGRLVEKKGFSYLIDACAILKSNAVKFKCLIVGEGPERETLIDKINEHGLQDDVFLLGSQTQDVLKTTINQSEFMVLPCVVTDSGDRDGLPTVLLEAMSMSLAVISTRVAGVPEIIDDKETGLLVAPNNPQQLSQAINQLLDNSETVLNMGGLARVKADRLFNLSANVTELKQLFNHVTSGDKS